MDPVTITLAFTVLDLLVKEIPAILNLVQQIKIAVAHSPETAAMLASIAQSTQKTDAATHSALVLLIASCKEG